MGELPFTRTRWGFILRFENGYSIDVGWSATCKAGTLFKENDGSRGFPDIAYVGDSAEVCCCSPNGEYLWIQKFPCQRRPERSSVGNVNVSVLLEMMNVLSLGGGRKKIENRLQEIVRSKYERD